MGLHLDVYGFNPLTGEDYRSVFRGTEEQLDSIIKEYEQSNEQKLREALMFETAVFFFTRLLMSDPPKIKRAIAQAENLSRILTKQDYGSRNGPNYQSMVKEVETIAQEGEGILTLMGWRSRLLFKEDPDGHLYLSISPESHENIKERFLEFSYVLGFDGGKIPIDDVCNWFDDLKNWDSFYQTVNQ